MLFYFALFVLPYYSSVLCLKFFDYETNWLVKDNATYQKLHLLLLEVSLFLIVSRQIANKILQHTYFVTSVSLFLLKLILSLHYLCHNELLRSH